MVCLNSCLAAGSVWFRVVGYVHHPRVPLSSGTTHSVVSNFFWSDLQGLHHLFEGGKNNIFFLCEHRALLETGAHGNL